MSASKRNDAIANGHQRPLMPRLAASTQNTKGIAPPKLAGYSTTPPIKRPTTSQTTPILPSTKSDVEEKATPISNFVNANVTPRSSSRQSRGGSSQSTPFKEADGTPGKIRPASTMGIDTNVDTSNVSQSPLTLGAKVPYLQQEDKHRSLPTSPNLARSPDLMHSPFSGEQQQNRFFYASDRPGNKDLPSRPQHKKTGSFVYANGEAESNSCFRSPQATPGSKMTREFTDPPIPLARPSATGRSTPLASETAKHTRQPSPPRSGFHLTYRKGASQVIPLQARGPSVLEDDPTRRRKSSIDDDQQSQHGCASGISSLRSPGYPSQNDAGFPFLTMFSMSSSKSSPIASPLGDSSLRSSGDRDHFQALEPELDQPQSPPSVIGSSSSDPQRNDAAAYARRERKIMDLEISNSSLLVINKSLEKEIRRQKMELRRYKRLSRKTSLEALRVSADRLSLDTNEDDEECDQDQDESDEESEGSHSDGNSFADDPMSPGAVTQSEARHRKRDQLRLQKDLAKHKQLLADSTRMNQSLQKCTSITESLIEEGTKALKYNVKREDVKLGGRVLSTDDE